MGWRDIAGAALMEKVEKEATHASHIPLIPHIPVKAENENSYAPAPIPLELERLITLVARHYDCTPTEVEDIRETASRDINGALTAYRAMAAEIARPGEEEAQARAAGMVLCRECSRLVVWQCLVAREGRIKGTAREYRPVQDVFRRCPEYHVRPYLNQSKIAHFAATENQPESLTG